MTDRIVVEIYIYVYTNAVDDYYHLSCECYSPALQGTLDTILNDKMCGLILNVVCCSHNLVIFHRPPLIPRSLVFCVLCWCLVSVFLFFIPFAIVLSIL